jgi:phage gp36-like protein
MTPLPTFLTAGEMNNAIYPETVAAISDGDASFMTDAMIAAVQEAAGYMSRFDYVTIFSQAGANRDPILLQVIKNMAVYHFIGPSNANINYEVALDRYNKAIRWLDKVADGRFAPVGWPVAPCPAQNTVFQVTATQCKRRNNY